MEKPNEAPPIEVEATDRTTALLTADGKKPRRRKPNAADLVGQDRPMLTRSQPAAEVEERRQPQAGGRGVRELSVTPDSYDSSARSVEAILSAGTAVRRTWFTEELEISATAIDLGRVERGVCPLLDTHNQYELNAVIGRITNVRIENDQLIGTLIFADTPAGRDIEARVARGELRAISIGYRVTKWLLVEVDDNDHETWRAVSWELLEASLVPVPADPNAVVRSDPGSAHGAIQENEDMKRNLPGGAGTPAASAPSIVPAPAVPEVRNEPTPAPQVEVRAAPAITATIILDRCARATELGGDFQAGLIRQNEATPLTEAALERAISDRLIEARATPTIDVRAGRSGTESAEYARAITAAVILRADPSVRMDDADVTLARDFRGMSLMELSRDYLERTGIRTGGMGRLELAGAALGLRYGAMVTSDFANALSAATSRRVREAYAAAPQTFSPIVSRGTLPDFKDTSIIGLGDAPQLLLVKENAEFTYGALADTGMAYRLQTYGRIIAITRQALINDDKQLFGRIPVMFGRKAADLESDLVWGTLVGNPTMADGVALFHASHGNLMTGAAITVESVGLAEAAMLNQKSAEGGNLTIRPEYLIVGTAKKVEAQQFLTAVAAAKTSDVNPFPGTLTLIVEPRVPGNQWYLSADPAAADTIEFSHLDGQESLYTETQPGFDVDGVKTKARLDVGAAPIDYRGLVKNPGN